MGGGGGSCGPQRVKHSHYHGSTLPRAGPWLSQPASGHPGTNWTMLAHSTWCTHFSPNTGGNCLWTQRTATGKARLANGRAEFPAKLATLSGGTKVNRGPPCWSGKVLPRMSCACGLIPQNNDLGSGVYLGTGVHEGPPATSAWM